MGEYLTSLPKRGEGALSSVSMKKSPCHVYSDSMHSKQYNWTNITYNRAAMQQLRSQVLTAHNTRNDTMSL